MRMLELFSGTQSVSRVARELGWETVSLDIDATHKPDLVMDILDFDETQYPRDHFFMIWASPDCRAYSQARTVAKIPKEQAMAASDELVAKTRQILDWFQCYHCIENPAHSRLWKRLVAEGLLSKSVVTSYCSFGTPYRKNTRLASNFPLILPKCPGPGCPQMIGTKHSQHAQKGGGGSHPSYKSTDTLHRIPEGLCHSILSQVLSHVNASGSTTAVQNGGGVYNS